MTNSSTESLRTGFRFPFLLVLKSGLLVGLLDILAAWATAYFLSGTTPAIVMRYIASGVYGREAFSQNLESATLMVVMGTIFHFCIALWWTFVFFWLYPRVKMFSAMKPWIGVFYGLAIWLAMNFVVLPLSNTPPARFTVSRVLIGVITLILMIGIPLSLIARRYISRN